MHLYRFDKKKANKIIALTSAFAITVSNSFSTVFAKDNTVSQDFVTTGGIAEPYVPPNAKKDNNNKPILDEDGDFILLDEDGKVIPKDTLKFYEIQPDSEGNIIYELHDYRTASSNARTVKKAVNNTTHNRVIRASADTKSSQVGTFPKNAVATVLKESNGWAQINYKNTTGWIASSFIVIASETPANSVKNITDSNVNIRSSNSTNSSIVGKVPSGKTAIALNYSNGWFNILYGDIVGWVSDDYIKYANPSNSTKITVTSSSLIDTHYVKHKTLAGNHQTTAKMTDSNGRHLYCLDPEKKAPNGHPFYKGSTLDDGTYRILKHGYPNVSITGDNTLDRVITQMAVWAYSDPNRIDINNIYAYKNNTKDDTMLNHIKTLYNKAKTASDTQTVSVKFSNTNLNASFNGDNFVTDYISLTGSGDIKSATTTLSFFDTDTGKQRTDIKVISQDGKTLSSVGLNTKFRLVIPKSSPKGSIKITGTSTIVHPMAYMYSSNLDGIQDAVLVEDVKETKTVTNNVVVTWNGVGKLTITKVDASSNTKLKGAEFTITDSTGNKVAVLTTDTNGTASSADLPFGTYKVQETKAPTGYELDSTVHTVEINSTTAINKTYTNKQILGSIQITKVDAEDDKVKLSGAEFTLYDSNGKEISKATSNNNGLVTFSNIPLGSYSIKETKAPNGYITDGQTISATIKSQGQLLKFTVKNSKKMGEVDFSKTDVSTGDIIEGATIEIKGIDEANKHINISFVSSKEGNRFKVPVGKYEFKETIAPKGYVLSTEVGTFEIKNNGEIVKANLKNTPIVGAVQITKVDAENKDTKLEGAEFTLYDSTGKELSKATSDKNGIVKFEKLAYGEYSIKETKAPSGYILVDNPINVKISEHNKTLTFTVTNSKKIGEVDFSKTDVSTGDIIEGATIEIKGVDEANKHINISFVSSKDGNRFKLPVGKYEFKETIAPEGYVLSTEVGTFEIKENGEVVKANLKNTPIVGSVEIIKIASEAISDNNSDTTDKPEQDEIANATLNPMNDAESSKPSDKDSDTTDKPEQGKNTKDAIKLKDAEFTLYDKDGKELAKAVTDESGLAKFDSIPYGDYTIKETKSPEGYVLVENPISFKISKHKEVLTYTVSNARAMGEVDFSKTDVSTGDIIEGAVIEIKGIDELNKDISITFRSSKEGNRFKLPTGKYEFKETVAPEGYILSEEVGTFEIKENGEVVKANLKNTPFTATLKILKVDYKDKSPLAGAEFTLTDKDGHKVHSGTTDKEGVLTFDNLKIGTYTLKETKAPNGYLLPENSIKVDVTTQSQTIELEVENKAKLAQTGGDFTISGLIYTGFVLMALAAILSRKESGGLQ